MTNQVLQPAVALWTVEWFDDGNEEHVRTWFIAKAAADAEVEHVKAEYGVTDIAITSYRVRGSAAALADFLNSVERG
jgi:hypothetical protein